MKKALITGITGQDGAYLSKLLLNKGYEVFGAFRRTAELNLNNLKFLKVDDKIKYVPIELLEFNNILRAIEKVQPDEQPIFTADVTALGPLRLLEAINEVNPKIKFYQASSSEMFGKVQSVPQNEKTPFHPRSPYSVSKLFGHWITINYRESYNIFGCNGILFNHESPLRGTEFVTRKITLAIARIKLGLQNEVRLGNLDAKRDWGYAAEYVEAMWLMLQQEQPDDYVIATGETHSVREFLEVAFKEAGIDIDWKGKGVKEKGIDRKTGKAVVVIDPEYFRPCEVDILVGDYTKAKEKLGWAPKTTFKELAKIMVKHDLKLIKDSIR
jgi:GDPmannose 4,6-dehydratase